MDVLVRHKKDHVTYFIRSKYFKRKGIKFYLYILWIRLKGFGYEVIE